MKSVIFLLALALISCSCTDGCIHNSTHCQCSIVPAGGSCLRHFSGSGSNTMCETYACGSGVVCDCMGDQLCSLDACAGTAKYRPTIPLPPSRTDPIGCEVVAASETCLTAVGHVQPGRGESCSTDSTCRGDLTCRCGNDVCVEDVSFDIHVIGDDVVNLYSCDGNMFGEVTTHHTEQTFSYSGVCQDLVIVVNNTFVEQGLAVAIDYNGATYASGVNLQMRVARAPPLLDGYTQCCSYEYPDSTFLEPTVLPIHTNAADYPAYASFETTHGGALPMSYPLTIQQHVDYVYKVSVPFCT